jgi:hypothetical protein
MVADETMMTRPRHPAARNVETSLRSEVESEQNYSLSEKATETRRAPDVDEGYTLPPPRKQPNVRQLAPGYIWNGMTQELIPVLPEDHPDYRKNQEILIEATRRWESGKQK